MSRELQLFTAPAPPPSALTQDPLAALETFLSLHRDHGRLRATPASFGALSRADWVGALASIPWRVTITCACTKTLITDLPDQAAAIIFCRDAVALGN